MTISEILKLNNNEIGLIGPGNSWLTPILEKMFGWSDVLRTHSILHDAFGRFFINHSLDRGYSYAIPEHKTSNFFRKNPLCGQISGMIYCIHKKLII